MWSVSAVSFHSAKGSEGQKCFGSVGIFFYLIPAEVEQCRGSRRKDLLRDSSSTLRSARNDMVCYSRLIKSENERFTLSNIPRASSCALLKPCLIDRFALLKTRGP